MPNGELPGILTLTDLNGKIETGEIETVLTVFPDAFGRLLGRHVPAMYFLEHVVQSGFDVLNTFTSGAKSSLHCRVETSTLRAAPWLGRAAIVFCTPYPEGSNIPWSLSPRELLAQQIANATEMGFQVRIAAVIRYYLFNESLPVLRAREYIRPAPHDGQQGNADTTQAMYAEVINEAVRRHLTQAGIGVSYTQPAGSPGQYETAMPARDAMTAADSLALLKHSYKGVAGLSGSSVTFMALPFAEKPGSNLTLQISLWDKRGRRNLFSGAEQEDAAPDAEETLGDEVAAGSDLEPEAVVEEAYDEGSNGEIQAVFSGKEIEYFLAGCQHHLLRLLPFFAPTVNSFKRLRREALSVGLELATIGSLARQGGRAHISCSLAGSDANPYLAMAALLGAGLDGIRNEMASAGVESARKHTENGSALTLDNALAELRADSSVGQLFGAEVAEQYHNVWSTEGESFQGAVTDWERLRYFEQA